MTLRTLCTYVHHLRTFFMERCPDVDMIKFTNEGTPMWLCTATVVSWITTFYTVVNNAVNMAMFDPV